eukprot:159682_1
MGNSQLHYTNTALTFPHQIDCSSINDCDSINIVLTALNTYQNKNLFKDNDETNKNLIELINDQSYKHIIDHYIHVITNHGDNINDVYNIIIHKYKFQQCSVKNCVLCIRHGRNREARGPRTSVHDGVDDNNAKYIVWRDIFDAMHCFLFHMYDFGYRVKKENLLNEDKKMEDNYDEVFESVYLSVQQKVTELDTIAGMHKSKANKFNINVMNDLQYDQLDDAKNEFKQDKNTRNQQDIYHGKSWYPTNYSTQCMMYHCNTTFTVINRKYNCKYCGKLVCNKCLKSKSFESTHVVKACTRCFEEQKALAQTTYEIDNEDVEDTFCDRLFNFLSTNVICKNKAHKLAEFLLFEQYDTDTVLYDNNEYEEKKRSNIYLFAISVNIIDVYLSMRQYINQGLNKTFSSSFSIGYTFYYWDYYKAKKKQAKQRIDYWNINDHLGYNEHELYIASKYSSLQYEILHNTIHPLPFEQYLVLIEKANQYIATQTVKKMKAKDIDSKIWTALHYGIPKDYPFLYEHLLSLFLYTDFTSISADFASTFRQTKQHQTLDEIKKRNREFAIWSQILRETVQYYGDNGSYYKNKDDKKVRDLAGPFYCGMSKKLALYEFNLRLCGPTSTSAQIEVAMRFGGREGIILELNNDGQWGAHFLTGFNCAQFSTYPQEDERLFVGGRHRIKLATIRVIQTCSNYKKFFKVFYHFHSALSGTRPYSNDLSRLKTNETLLLSKLISQCPNEYDSYINETWNLFRINKKSIVFHYYYLTTYYSEIKDIIMDSNNLLKPIIYDLFPNLNEINLYTTYIQHTQMRDDYLLEYKISFLPLIGILSKMSNVTICIRASHDIINVKPSWITKTWTLLELEKKCMEQNVKVALTTGKDLCKIKEDCVTMSKIDDK